MKEEYRENTAGMSLDMVLTEIYVRIRVYGGSKAQKSKKELEIPPVVRPLKGHETMVILLLGILGPRSEQYNLNTLHEYYFNKISLPTFCNTVSSLYEDGFIDKIASRFKSGFSIRLSSDIGIKKLNEIKYNISLSLKSVLDNIPLDEKDKDIAKSYLVDLINRHDKTINNSDKNIVADASSVTE